MIPARVPATMHINTQAFHDLAAKFHRGQDEATAATVGMMSEVGLYLERQTALGEPVNTGTLRGGVTSGTEIIEPGRVRAFVAVQGPAAAYALASESGSKPHWPPRDAIELWVRQKGLHWTDAKGHPLSIKSMGFLIARGIAAHGTKASHAAQNAVERGSGEVNRIVERHVADFMDRILSGRR